MSEIGQRIKELRKRKGLTQLELSEGIVSRSYLSQIEKGNVIPTSETIRRLSQKLNYEEEEFYKSPSLNMQNLNDFKKNIYLLESYVETNDYQLAASKFNEIDLSLDGVNDNDKGIYYWAAGVIEEHQGNKIEARRNYLESLNYLSNSTFYDKYVRTLNYIGQHYIEIDEFEEGFFVLNKAYRQILYSHINGVLKIQNLYYLALNHTKIGEVFSAILFLEEAKRHSEQMNIFYKYGEISLLLAVCYKEISKWHDAVKENEKALKYFELTNDENQIATIYYNIGVLYLEIELYDDSEDFLKKSEILFNKINHKKGLSMVDLALLNVYQKNKPLSLTKDFADKIIMNKSLENKILIYLTLGTAYFKEDDYLNSYTNLKTALELFNAPKSTPEVISGCKLMIDVCFKLNKNDDAKKYYNLLIDLENKKIKMNVLI